MIFSLFTGTSEAAPEVRQEIVELLKPKLNSDRIEYFFGSYGIDQLAIDSPAFPGSRIANLHSIDQDKKIMRTLAIVDFLHPVHPDLCSIHCEIVAGKSIGTALREQGWIIHKKPVYFGEISLSQELMDWMDEYGVDKAAVHIYRLEVTRNNLLDSIPYCIIIEVHSPKYLSKKWLQAFYGDQYDKFSIFSEEAATLLFRLSILVQEFPF